MPHFLTPFLVFEIRNLASISLCLTTSLSHTIVYLLPAGSGPGIMHSLSINVTKNKKGAYPSFHPLILRIF